MRKIEKHLCLIIILLIIVILFMLIKIVPTVSVGTNQTLGIVPSSLKLDIPFLIYDISSSIYIITYSIILVKKIDDSDV